MTQFIMEKESDRIIEDNTLDLFKKASIRVNDCMERNPNCKIQIIDGRYSKGFKELVAIAIEDYLKDKMGQSWQTGNINKDINSEDLAAYLNKVFPEEAPWEVNSSQSAFDIYSIKAKVSIELKSDTGTSRKRKGGYSSSNLIVGNATIYPLEAKIRSIVPQKRWDIGWSEDDLNTMLDVLVVFVRKVGGKLNDYRIVDGSYWGFTYEDYLSCREFFSIINDSDILTNILKLILEKYPHQIFAERMLNDQYNGNVNLQLRKLISYTNPLGE